MGIHPTGGASPTNVVRDLVGDLKNRDGTSFVWARSEEPPWKVRVNLGTSRFFR